MLITVLNCHLPPLSWGISILDPVAHLMFLLLAQLRWGGGDDITFTLPLPRATHLVGCSLICNHDITSVCSTERNGPCIPRPCPYC